MGKLKAKTQSPKISGKPESSRGCCSQQCPWFSFKSVTKNTKYNLSGLSGGNEREQVLWGLYSRFLELSGKPWSYWILQSKQTGLETLSYDQLCFAANSDMQLAKDTTIYVIRFDTHRGHGKGRILGYKETPCSVLHVIGFDLDFSAYDHG